MAHRTKTSGPITAQDRDAQLLRSFRSAHQQNQEKSLAAVSPGCRGVGEAASNFEVIWVGLFRCAKGVSPHGGWRNVLAIAHGGYPWIVASCHRSPMIKITSSGQQAPLTLGQPFRTLNFLEPQRCITKKFIQCVFQAGCCGCHPPIQMVPYS